MNGVDSLGSNQECRIGYKYLSAWQVLGKLEIAEVLRDYVASIYGSFATLPVRAWFFRGEH